MRSHFLHLLLYSGVVATFFAVLLRRRRTAQVRLFLGVFAAMVGGVLALAYLMFPFPR
jgi:hypothetical protein